METLYRKDEVLFAVCWIVIYVVGFGNADALSVSMGLPKALTAVLGLVLSVALYGFIRRKGLTDYYGLCRFAGDMRTFLYFLPLIFLTGMNLYNGMTLNMAPMTAVLYVISMCWVGFLEEVIFRGLLFKGMCRSGVVAAMVVSSLSFGAGHIVNVFLGAPVFETLLQLVYASAIGFCYTAIFYVGGSLLPCILSHAVFNSLSAFAVEPSDAQHILFTLIHTVVGVGYGVWLLRSGRRTPGQPAD